ncbi:MAG: aldehyde ferredoxin oxidoreductase [Clostridia bacterium]|nr:aldehyde ferredoxin oxidoreductase [Clostridia bacterium]
MEKILKVDLKNKEIKWQEDFNEFKYYWGRGYIAAVLNHEVNPTCEPLGPYNKLIFARGPLAGTPVPCSGRLSIGGKSPLTGGIKEANAGGTMGHGLGKLGIKAIIIENSFYDNGLYGLYISKDDIHLFEASDLRGLSTSQTVENLQKRFGEKISAAVIGPTGEMGLLAAGIAVTDIDGRPSRFAGRGGLGAVMGAKGLKAIVVDSANTSIPKPANRNEFILQNRKLVAMLKENPLTSKTYTEYGTAAALSVVNALGALPTRNFSLGQFEFAEKINGDALHDAILERGGSGETSHACMAGCTIKCSNVFADKDGKEVVAPLEFETLGLVGSNLLIGSLDEIAVINARLNELGLDTIETGAALGLLMERGIISFGNAEGVRQLLDEVEKGTVLGRVVGSGALVVGRVMGLSRIPVVKGQAMPAYDPRGIKGTGVTYATSPMGADHTAGHTLRAPVNHLEPKGQAKIAETNQINMAGIDSLGMCMMVVPALGGKFDALTGLIDAFYGWQLDSDFIARTGFQVLKLEKQFNEKAGITNIHDRLPEFVYNEPLEPHQSIFDVSDEDIKGIFNYQDE